MSEPKFVLTVLEDGTKVATLVKEPKASPKPEADKPKASQEVKP